MNMRKLTINSVTFIGGFYFFLEYLLPSKIGEFEFGVYHEQILHGVQVVGLMAIGLGLINITRVHGTNILKSKKGWLNSVALLLGLIVTLTIMASDMIQSEKANAHWQNISALGLFATHIENTAAERSFDENASKISLIRAKLIESEKALSVPRIEFQDPIAQDTWDTSQSEFAIKLAQARESTTALEKLYKENAQAEAIKTQTESLASILKDTARPAQGISNLLYDTSVSKRSFELIFNGFFAPLGSAMFSLLAFYIAAAAYRSFRIRSFEAFLMMSAAIIVMLGQIPHGPLYIYEGLPDIRLWILKNISTPAFRAIYFGSIIAGLSMAIRMWLSLEKSPLASDTEE